MSDIDASRYRSVLGHFPTGVTVVTASTPDGPVGMAISSFTSVSLDPPLVGFFAATRSSSWQALRRSSHFAVNVLASGQEDVCRTFATSGADRFAAIGWTPLPSGAPRLDGAVAWLECERTQVTPAGDHELCLGTVVDLATGDDDRAEPLVFFRGAYHQLRQRPPVGAGP